MRISWEQYALRLAQTAALRSEDPYVQVGAVALRHDNSVGGIGYNGAPAGVEIDWKSRDSRRPYVVHAEPNALRYTSPGECYMLVTTLEPCANCLTIAATYGIKKIRFLNRLTDSALSKKMAKKFGMDVAQLEVEKVSRLLNFDQSTPSLKGKGPSRRQQKSI